MKVYFFACFHLEIVFKIVFVKNLLSWDLHLFFVVTATHSHKENLCELISLFST